MHRGGNTTALENPESPTPSWNMTGARSDEDDESVEGTDSDQEVVERPDHLRTDMPHRLEDFPIRLPVFSLTTRELTKAYGLGIKRLPRLLVKSIDKFSQWSSEPMNLSRESRWVVGHSNAHSMALRLLNSLISFHMLQVCQASPECHIQGIQSVYPIISGVPCKDCRSSYAD